MMDGFQYNGRHCSEFNVYYIPKEKERWFPSPAFEIYDVEFGGRDGGYFYGKRTKVRTFTLNCYFEDIDIEKREGIRYWLGNEGIGEQVFDSRPGVVYYVTLSKIIEGANYVSNQSGIDTLYSGTFQVTFSAYKPYGYLKEKTFTGLDEYNLGPLCGIMESGLMPAAPTISSTDFLLYNPGTKTCNTVIEIGGTGTDITIANETNGSKCVLKSLPANGYLIIDGEYGTIRTVYNGDIALDFSYHDEGYLTLAPYLPRNYGQIASITNGSPLVEFMNYSPNIKDIGRYVYVDGRWQEIVGTMTYDGIVNLREFQTSTATQETKIVTMNHITITGTNLSLTRQKIDYTPMIV